MMRTYVSVVQSEVYHLKYTDHLLFFFSRDIQSSIQSFVAYHYPTGVIESESYLYFFLHLLVQHMTMEPVIPITYGTPISAPFAPPATAPEYTHDIQTATVIDNGGGSRARVMLPPDPGQPLNNGATLSESIIQALTDQGFTKGLIEALVKNKLAFPLSLWIVDNSGSMATRDGHRLVETKSKTNHVKFVDCTRWAEMQQTVDYHAELATMLKSPTVFRMLNDPGRQAGPQQFSIAERGDEYLDQDLAIAKSTMLNAAPGGVTPLISHLQEIRQNILAMETSLRNTGSKVVLVLATDGLPTDIRGVTDHSVNRQFTEALRSLEGLPIWVVVRLCTDDDDVVEYWNNLDSQLELSLEVLDDYVSEAAEVYEHNKWLNYGLQMHRIREMGFYSRLFDMLDERPLAKDELREFFRLLFGDGMMDGVPDPHADWNGFYQAIDRLVRMEKNTWNPKRKRMEPWVDMRSLKKMYGLGWFASIFG